MKRRDFLKLSFTALLAACAPKGNLTMLPNQTNRYGDMLREFYEGIKNNNLSEVRLNEIVRVFNELAVREEKYRSWLRLQDNKIGFNNLDLPFEPIYSTVLENDKSELVIPIPAKYKHLLVVGQVSINGTGGASATTLHMQVNGDTGVSSYSYQELFAIGTSVNGGQDLTYDSMVLSVVKADGGSAAYSGTFFGYMPHYNNATYYKMLIRLSGYFSGAGAQINSMGNVYLGTSPITSARIFPNVTAYPNAKLEAGSLISVYGIF